MKSNSHNPCKNADAPLTGLPFRLLRLRTKTGAYQNIFGADNTADLFPFRSAIWTDTRGRTGYANVI